MSETVQRMSPETWADERRSALADMSDAERVTACRHSFGRHGTCHSCGATAQEMGY